MDRRMTLRRILIAFWVLLASALLLTCANPINLLDTLETEVKIANKKFLVVNSVTPALNAADVNPGLAMTIVFDRELDESTISDGILSFLPSTGITSYEYTYTAATRTLSINADPYLLDDTPYTVTLTRQLEGLDGSELQNEYVWGFTTGTYPAGNVHINSNALATNSTSATLNMVYNSAVDEFRYSFVSENDLLTNPAINWEIKTSSWPTTLPGTDGVKTVWIQFKDTDPNPDVLSIVQADEIFYDTNPPVVNSFRINSNAAYTNTTSVTLNNNVSDLTPLEMRFQNGTSAGGSWEAYSSTKAWTLANNVGTRAVTAEFKDSAGNSTTVATDYIIYGVPTVSSASLGSATLGAVTVNFAAGTEDFGTDFYFIYRRDYPSGATYTYLGNGSSTSVNVSVAQGQLYYFHVRIYNSNSGYGDYSTTSALGYTSDIAIIYDGADSADTQTATDMKTILTTNIPGTYGPTVTGTMPSWSVTLIPQSLVSTTYAAANVFYGYPLIVTPGSDVYANANQSRNVTEHGHGVFAMGAGGTRLLDTVETYWSSWGFTGTNPADIGWGESATSAASVFMYTWTSGNSVWSSPLSSTAFPNTAGVVDHNARTQIGYSSLSAVCVYRSTDTNPTDGWLYGKEDAASSHYFPVVRQGRFLQFGFYADTDRYYTGWVYLTNLVYRMSAAYY